MNKLLLTALLLLPLHASMLNKVPNNFNEDTVVSEPTVLDQLAYLRDTHTSHVEAMRNELVTYATEHVTEPYTWGGSYKWSKFDCSSLVQGAYDSIGVSIPRTATQQYRTLKTSVKVKEIKRGDLVYYLTDKRRKLPVTHVVMYIGNGKVVEAKSRKKGIIISKFTTKRLVGIRRVIGD